ncbi:hypothetical protein [Dyella terrae]|uniref:hypothetical protein n=1 Tax=Dyella terrae TaxID=522259 RepID=UPI001EFE5975|nr:hypothetical protein [Dyella terrae]ULU23381.1 hypothetical protein DYST_00277 [Dyella terrae]
MANKNAKKEVIVIGDDLINQAIMAIESIEPTPEELEAEQLAKLIPSIRMAMGRGESDDKIRKKVKSIIPKLHYTKVDALLAAAAKLASDQLLGGVQ